jgi:hypothetical protein
MDINVRNGARYVRWYIRREVLSKPTSDDQAIACALGGRSVARPTANGICSIKVWKTAVTRIRCMIDADLGIMIG